MSSTNEGNPPIDMKVTKPKTKDAQEPLAWKKTSQAHELQEKQISCQTVPFITISIAFKY